MCNLAVLNTYLNVKRCNGPFQKGGNKTRYYSEFFKNFKIVEKLSFHLFVSLICLRQ